MSSPACNQTVGTSPIYDDATITIIRLYTLLYQNPLYQPAFDDFIGHSGQSFIGNSGSEG